MREETCKELMELMEQLMEMLKGNEIPCLARKFLIELDVS